MTQDRVTEERLREMLAGAAKATPGRWTVSRLMSSMVVTAQRWRICVISRWDEANARHIAACDPQTITSLITELLELRSEASRVPEGWKLVPVEPTDAMTAAGFSPFLAAHDPMFSANEPCRPIYRAMIAAAPLPASPDTQTQENDRG